MQWLRGNSFWIAVSVACVWMHLTRYGSHGPRSVHPINGAAPNHDPH